MIRYLVCPGNIGKTYVSGPQLMRLYGVDPKECLLYIEGRTKAYDGLTKLKPQPSGVYKLAETK